MVALTNLAFHFIYQLKNFKQDIIDCDQNLKLFLTLMFSIIIENCTLTSNKTEYMESNKEWFFLLVKISWLRYPIALYPTQNSQNCSLWLKP